MYICAKFHENRTVFLKNLDHRQTNQPKNTPENNISVNQYDNDIIWNSPTQ